MNVMRLQCIQKRRNRSHTMLKKKDMKKAMATITDVCNQIEGITAHAQYLATTFVIGQMV